MKTSERSLSDRRCIPEIELLNHFKINPLGRGACLFLGEMIFDDDLKNVFTGQKFRTQTQFGAARWPVSVSLTDHLHRCRSASVNRLAIAKDARHGRKLWLISGRVDE